MLKVGVTGGIGSGKTTVCQLFELLGVPVFYSDLVSKEILAKDPEVRDSVISLFGERAFNGSIPDRAFLASKVFNDAAALMALNAILHPKVREHFEQWCTQQNSEYVLNEAAILFEAGSHKKLDAVIVVSAPDELRIDRVIKRDGVSKEAVLERISKQMPQEEKVALADYVITNDEGTSLIEQVQSVHREILEIETKE